MAVASQLFKFNGISSLSRCGTHYRLFARTCVQHFIKNNFSRLYRCSSNFLNSSSQVSLPHFDSSCNKRNGLTHFNSSSSSSRNFSTQTGDSDKGSLVYLGRIGSMFKTLKVFSLTTSAVGLSLQPYLFFTYQDAPVVTALPFFAALNMFVFVNPLLIHHIGKKYVMEVYFNQGTKVFTAVLMSFFARKYSFTFTADDVHVPDVPGMFSILSVKGRPLFVLESDFNDIEVYKHMMGFDKPLDLSFLKDNKKDQTESEK